MDPNSKKLCYSERHIRRKIKEEHAKSIQKINSNYLKSQCSSSSTFASFTEDNIRLPKTSSCYSEEDDCENIEFCNEVEQNINDEENVDYCCQTETNFYESAAEDNLQNNDKDIWLDDILGEPDEIKESDVFHEIEFDYRYSDNESDIDEFEFDDNANDENDTFFMVIETDKEIVSAENVNRDCDKYFEMGDAVTEISDSLKAVLSQWAVKCMIPHLSLRKLLHLIRIHIPSLSLPLDSRTLLKTPRHSEVFNIQGGLYCHFKLKKAIEKIIKKRLILNIYDENIDIMINIDGAPLGKSSEKNLWPILCSEKNVTDVYIVGVFCGISKTKDVNEFLEPFVNEAIEFVNNGFLFNEKTYKINIYALILDAPAKAFVLNVKYHSGYDCCTKCDIEGTMYRCVCFPGNVGILRTDEDFRQYNYIDDYQKGESILTSIPNLGLVSCVPLDPMHLVYLGCTRKLLLIWLGANLFYKLSLIKQNIISKKLVSLKNYMTYDFNRRPRELKFIKFFKATEFRLFLLYTGVIVLKDILDSDAYLNFLTLHVAITILSNSKFCSASLYIDYAEKLLEKFVKHFQKIYGPEYVSYTFHNLLHLANDAKKYGELEKFSAFRFENFIAMIKRLIRKGNQPFQQLLLRCAEIEIMEEPLLTGSNERIPQVYHQYNQGPITDEYKHYSRYKELHFNTFKINCTDNKNNYVQINNSVVVEVCNFVKNSHSNIYVIGKQIPTRGSLYEHPLPSNQIGINIVQKSENILQSWDINDITAKLLRLPYGRDFVTFPLVHTQKS